MFSCQAPVAVLTDCNGSNLLVATDVQTARLVLVSRLLRRVSRSAQELALTLATRWPVDSDVLDASLDSFS